MRFRSLELDQQDNDALQAAWEQLTTALLRKGFGYLWMKHFVDSRFNELIADPMLRLRMGVESTDGQSSPLK